MQSLIRFPYDLFISYAADDREWVKGYLLDALNSANVHFISEETFRLGVPRIAEFERAIAQSKRTLLVLSPAYMADGVTQFIDLMAVQYGIDAAIWPVIPLLLHKVVLPPHLQVLTRLDATRSDKHEDIIRQLCAELACPTPTLSVSPQCPYPGMVAFREKDNQQFYGREAEIQELVAALRYHRFCAVIGASGSGKSSLLFAGLFPKLRTSNLFGSGAWLMLDMRPGEHPSSPRCLA